MQSTQIMGTILDSLLPQELRIDVDALMSASTDPAFTGSANRYKEQLESTRHAYSKMFFEPNFAHRSPLEEAFAQYYVSRRDLAQSVLQLYTSAINSRIPRKRLPFGAEVIEKVNDLNEIVDELTYREMTERQDDNKARLKMRDDIVKETKGLIKRIQETAGIKSVTELPSTTGKASEGLESQRILSSDETRLMLGNIAMTAKSVVESADKFLTR